ncbi:uncharacterized protein [Argopecten irradians]|uniref:uncharacterized protein isoform X3 n=1 Tax=Argopecten irradians TaxID=31199 RepID=UPI00371D4E5D
MKMQSAYDVCNTHVMCSSVSKDNGGHNQETITVQTSDSCSCCAKCRLRWRIQNITFCCICVVIIAMCCVTIGYTSHTCALTKETFYMRIVDLEQKINRLQKQILIKKVSHKLPNRATFLQGQNLDENRDSNDNELETDEYYLNDNISKEMKIVKRSANRCIEEKTEKKRKKCLKRQKRKKKERSTGKSLVRFVKTTVQKALGNSVEHIVAEAIRKRQLLSVHFEGDGNEHRPRDDFAGRFHKWQYSDWAYKRPDLKEKFMLYHTSGTVTIAEGGLYMLYAQVTLKGRPDQGFKVVARHTNNSENILMKCMMDYVSDGEQDVRTDGNITCSSVGVFRIDAGDSVFLTHSDHTNVKADFRENASFFGFVKLS